jgi:hypothetical protein
MKFVCDINSSSLLMKNIARMTYSFRTDVDQLLFSESSIDLNINVDDHIIPVHKFILQLRSHVFRTMLSSGMMESSNNQIIISDFNFRVVKKFINFLYLDAYDLDVLSKDA